MEAVTAIIKNLLKNMRVVLILGVILGLLLGLIIGWGLWPVQYTNATPEVLREDLQKDYLRMTIDSYNRTGDPNVAMQRWNGLGEKAGAVYGMIQADPGYLNPVDVQNFGNLVQSVTGTPIVTTATAPESSTATKFVLYASVIVVIALLGVDAFPPELVQQADSMVARMQTAAATRVDSIAACGPSPDLVRPPWHGRGQGFESPKLHQFRTMVLLSQKDA